MQKLKVVLYYVGWSAFWLALLIGAIWFSVETKMIRFTAPLLFLSFIAYAFYAMLKTKPALPPTEEKQSPTLETKDKAETSE